MSELSTSDDELELFCEAFHDAYERAAMDVGWQTQQRSRVPWTFVPAENKAAMRQAAREVLARHDANVIEKVAGFVSGYGAQGLTDDLLAQSKEVRSRRSTSMPSNPPCRVCGAEDDHDGIPHSEVADAASE